MSNHQPITDGLLDPVIPGENISFNFFSGFSLFAGINFNAAQNFHNPQGFPSTLLPQNNLEPWNVDTGQQDPEQNLDPGCVTGNVQDDPPVQHDTQNSSRRVQHFSGKESVVSPPVVTSIPGRDGFRCLTKGNYTIAFSMPRQLINLYHILRGAGVPRRHGGSWMLRIPKEKKVYIHRGGRAMVLRGTYVKFKYARRFCEQYDINSALLDDVMLAAGVAEQELSDEDLVR